MPSLTSLLALALAAHGATAAAVHEKRQQYSAADYAQYAPDFSKGQPPYPPLKENGKDIDIKNLRGTRIFGGAGCDGDTWSAIKESWHDFHDVAATDGLKSNIDWKSDFAKEIWGPPDKIPDDRKKYIQGRSSRSFCRPRHSSVRNANL